MRLDLSEFNFEIQYIKGGDNVTEDALSRVVISSDELKQNSIFVVNTRSIVNS